MIRWRFILTRAIFLLVVVSVIYLSAGPAVGWVARIAYEKSTGGRLDIAETRVHFFPPVISFCDVQMGDPTRERENYATFERIDLGFDGNMLLHRRFVVDRARITGLQFSSERETSGRVEEDAVESPSDGPSMLGGFGDSISDWITDSVETRTKTAVESLQTVHVARALEDEWKQRYEQEVARAKRIEDTVHTIRDSVRAVDNPLRDLPRVQQAIAEAQRLQADLTEARRILATAPNQFQVDMQRLETARQQDMQQIANYLPTDGSIDSLGELTSAIIKKYYEQPMQAMRDYVSIGRSAADLTVRKPKPSRETGLDFDLEGRNKDPLFVVRKCEISGNVSIDRNQYVLTGIVQDFAVAPEPTPLRVRMKLDGAQEIGLDYTRDPAQVMTHHLTVHVPQLPPPVTDFKAGKQLSIRTAAVPVEMWAEIATDGKEISGRLVAKQRGASIQATLGGDHQLVQLVQASLNQSLASVQELQLTAAVHGTWDQPKVQCESNLQPALNTAFQSATKQIAAYTEQKIRQEVDRAYQRQTQQLESIVAKQQAELDTLLARVESEVREVSDKVAGQLNRSPLQMGQLQNTLKRF